MLTRNLQLYVASEPDRLLFHGRKKTPAMSFGFEEISKDGHCSYAVKLAAVQTHWFSRKSVLVMRLVVKNRP
jgi:hypothetical protein